MFHVEHLWCHLCTYEFIRICLTLRKSFTTKDTKVHEGKLTELYLSGDPGGILG
jgi:hypothetical protein